MTFEAGRTNNEARVRELVERWAQAIRDRNVEEAVACFAPDILIFDLAPPLQQSGQDAIGGDLQGWFSTWDGPIDLEIRDLRISAEDYLACCTSLQRMRGTKTDGEKPDVWIRSTMCLHKTGGDWRIAHQHNSTPFYMDGSYRAALDLRP